MIRNVKEALLFISAWEEDTFIEDLNYQLEVNEIKNAPTIKEEAFKENNSLL